MDVTRFKEKLAALYKAKDPANRMDHADRLAGKARAYAVELGKRGEDVDLEMVEVLAYSVTVKAGILPHMAMRATLEACLVEQGWTPLKGREMFKALERLPDAPKSIEEQLVVDAESVLRLGIVGLFRQLSTAGANGVGLSDAVEAALRGLSRRIYTGPAMAEAAPLRDELRDLAIAARKRLEELKPKT